MTAPVFSPPMTSQPIMLPHATAEMLWFSVFTFTRIIFSARTNGPATEPNPSEKSA